MERYIVNYNPNDISKEFLQSLDWDIIELPFEIDVDKLLEWYNSILANCSQFEFSFFDNPYIKKEFLPDSQGMHGYSKKLYGGISSWGIDWPAETELPIPPPFAALPEYYPELFDNSVYRIQTKYKIGYFKELINRFGYDAFRYSRITKHNRGAGILGHVDGNAPALRLHIPIISNDGSKFLFGENLERSYSFNVGKVYILNASVWHSTENTKATRAHIISDPPFNKIAELVGVI